MNRRSSTLITLITVIAVGGVVIELARRPQPIKDVENFAKYETLNGSLVAKEDLARGHVRWKTMGFPPVDEVAASLYRDVLGLERDWFFGCRVTDGVVRFRDEYNAVVYDYLVEQYGSAKVYGVLGPRPLSEASKANKSVDVTPTAVTPAAGAPGAPSAGVHHH